MGTTLTPAGYPLKVAGGEVERVMQERGTSNEWYYSTFRACLPHFFRLWRFPRIEQTHRLGRLALQIEAYPLFQTIEELLQDSLLICL